MATLPSSLALTSIADGSNIVASDHRNNYAAIQTEANALLGILDDGLAGQVFKGVGTTVSFDYPPGYQWDRKTVVAGTTAVTATTEGTSTAVATGNSVTYDGSEVKVEYWAPRMTGSGAIGVTFVFYSDATVVGTAYHEFGAAGAIIPKVECFHTPAAGAHTYTVKAFVTSGTATFYSGAGGSGNLVPAIMRVTKA
jgi:hypothetical protein